MKKVLVVVDMQNDFTYGTLRSEEAISIIPNVEEKIRSFDGEVVYTLDTHYEDYLKTQEGKNLPVVHCVLGTTGHDLVEPLKALQQSMNSKTFQKNTFGSEDLVLSLKQMNNESPLELIELIGVCTDICVISNAMLIKAALPEVPVVVDAMCCAGVSVQSHLNALQAMKACQINIINE